MYSTFNIPREFTGQCARKSQSDNPVYNSYYQWVSLFLIFQAFLFYCPRIIWLMSEGGMSQRAKIRKKVQFREDALLASKSKINVFLKSF